MNKNFINTLAINSIKDYISSCQRVSEAIRLIVNEYKHIYLNWMSVTVEELPRVIKPNGERYFLTEMYMENNHLKAKWYSTDADKKSISEFFPIGESMDIQVEVLNRLMAYKPTIVEKAMQAEEMIYDFAYEYFPEDYDAAVFIADEMQSNGEIDITDKTKWEEVAQAVRSTINED